MRCSVCVRAEQGIFIWITPPNGTWRVSLLDQNPFREYQLLKYKYRQLLMKKKHKSYGQDVEVECSLGALREVLSSDKFYVNAGAKKCGLIPFEHDLSDLQMAAVYGVEVEALEDITLSSNNSNNSGKRKRKPKAKRARKAKKRTVNDVHRCGGWLHDSEILEIVRAKWGKEIAKKEAASKKAKEVEEALKERKAAKKNVKKAAPKKVKKGKGAAKKA